MRQLSYTAPISAGDRVQHAPTGTTRVVQHVQRDSAGRPLNIILVPLDGRRSSGIEYAAGRADIIGQHEFQAWVIL